MLASPESCSLLPSSEPTSPEAHSLSHPQFFPGNEDSLPLASPWRNQQKPWGWQLTMALGLT